MVTLIYLVGLTFGWWWFTVLGLIVVFLIDCSLGG